MLTISIRIDLEPKTLRSNNTFEISNFYVMVLAWVLTNLGIPYQRDKSDEKWTQEYHSVFGHVYRSYFAHLHEFTCLCGQLRRHS